MRIWSEKLRITPPKQKSCPFFVHEINVLVHWAVWINANCCYLNKNISNSSTISYISISYTVRTYRWIDELVANLSVVQNCIKKPDAFTTLTPLGMRYSNCRGMSVFREWEFIRQLHQSKLPRPLPSWQGLQMGCRSAEWISSESCVRRVWHREPL